MKLVSLVALIPDSIVDLRYATVRNITGSVLYDTVDQRLPRLDAPAAEALARAADSLRERSLRLVIWDSFRPASVQRQLLSAHGRPDNYVLRVSNHGAGRAIDLTLADKPGNYLDMGTDFDDFGPLAHADSADLSAQQLAHRAQLASTMESAGFTQWPYEWWHFDFTT